MESQDEILLSGGALLSRGVVQIGRTVRRPWGPWTPSVHRLLQYLTAAGFPYSPSPQGRDEKGREILSYIEGRDSGSPYCSALVANSGAFQLGRLVRLLQTALASYECPSDAIWQFAVGQPSTESALQHGDLGPWNILWRGNHVVAIIDWDFVHPGYPLFDVGYLAWSAIPFMDDDASFARGFPEIPDRRSRLVAFCEGCDLQPNIVIESVLAAQEITAARIVALGGSGLDPWTLFYQQGLHKRAVHDRAWTLRRCNR